MEKPKAREVYAAQYEDRVVHHWLVPQLEAAINRDFIHDAASNRCGKGTHFAVDRVQSFMRRMARRGTLPRCRPDHGVARTDQRVARPAVPRATRRVQLPVRQ